MSNKNSNKVWMWVGVILLIAILVYWLFSIDLFESADGYINGN